MLIEGEGTWALEASRYLHLNPVWVQGLKLGKLAAKAESRGWTAPNPEEVSRRLVALRGHRWSSYAAYAGYRKVPAWLTTVVLLKRVSEGSDRECHAKYRRYVEAILRQGVEPENWMEWRERIVLGSAVFRRQISCTVKGDRRQQPQLRYCRERVPCGRVIKAVETVRGESSNSFRDRYGDWGRDAVLCLARRHSGMTLCELGNCVGGVASAAVSEAIRRFSKTLARNKSLKLVCMKAEAILKMWT